MNQRIIYPTDDGVAIIIPTGEIAIEEVARKDVPAGVPYKIVDVADIPGDRTFRNAWEVEITEPDGYGIGVDAWFAEKEAPRLAKEAEEKAAYEAEKAAFAEKIAQKEQEGALNDNN